MGVAGQRRDIPLSHDPETDNDDAIRKINKKLLLLELLWGTYQ